MADTGAILPGLGSNEDRNGKAGWTTPESIQTGTDVEDARAFGKNDYVDWLRASDFGFAVPADATVDGIEVEIRRKGSTADKINDSSLRLVDADGANVGDDKASATKWPTSTATVTYGGAADKWSASPTPAMVNDSDFGVRLSAYGESSTAYVYWIKITVYYTEAVTDNRRRSAFFQMM